MKIRNFALTALIAFIALVLGGCFGSSEIRLSNGTVGHNISCLLYPSTCISKAGKICGSTGYDVVEWIGDQHLIIQCRDSSSSYYAPQQQDGEELRDWLWLDAPAVAPPVDVASVKQVLRDWPRNEEFLLQARSNDGSNCALWDVSSVKAVGNVTWTGQCKDGWASGPGLATFNYVKDGTQLKVHATGAYKAGKAHGSWELQSEVEGQTFSESSGLFHNGYYLGEWTIVLFNGASVTASFKDNQLHGKVIFTTPDGHDGYLEFVDGEFQE